MNVTLIGMPGVGKTVVGGVLAGELGYSFVDTDELIEEETGSRLQDIIHDRGEKALSALEEEIVLGLRGIDDAVISTGGSVIYSVKSMEWLSSNSLIVHLHAPLETIRERINQSTRGVIGLEEKGLEALYVERLVLYRRYAEVTVELKGDSTPEEDTDAVLRAIEGFIN